MRAARIQRKGRKEGERECEYAAQLLAARKIFTGEADRTSGLFYRYRAKVESEYYPRYAEGGKMDSRRIRNGGTPEGE